MKTIFTRGDIEQVMTAFADPNTKWARNFIKDTEQRMQADYTMNPNNPVWQGIDLQLFKYSFHQAVQLLTTLMKNLDGEHGDLGSLLFLNGPLPRMTEHGTKTNYIEKVESEIRNEIIIGKIYLKQMGMDPNIQYRHPNASKNTVVNNTPSSPSPSRKPGCSMM